MHLAVKNRPTNQKCENIIKEAAQEKLVCWTFLGCAQTKNCKLIKQLPWERNLLCETRGGILFLNEYFYGILVGICSAIDFLLTPFPISISMLGWRHDQYWGASEVMMAISWGNWIWCHIFFDHIDELINGVHFFGRGKRGEIYNVEGIYWTRNALFSCSLTFFWPLYFLWRNFHSVWKSFRKLLFSTKIERRHFLPVFIHCDLCQRSLSKIEKNTSCW